MSHKTSLGTICAEHCVHALHLHSFIVLLIFTSWLSLC